MLLCFLLYLSTLLKMIRKDFTPYATFYSTLQIKIFRENFHPIKYHLDQDH